jgi:hypothetical protein
MARMHDGARSYGRFEILGKQVYIESETGEEYERLKLVGRASGVSLKCAESYVVARILIYLVKRIVVEFSSRHRFSRNPY